LVLVTVAEADTGMCSPRMSVAAAGGSRRIALWPALRLRTGY
jgi:hypothetical protein